MCEGADCGGCDCGGCDCDCDCGNCDCGDCECDCDCDGCFSDCKNSITNCFTSIGRGCDRCCQCDCIKCDCCECTGDKSCGDYVSSWSCWYMCTDGCCDSSSSSGGGGGSSSSGSRRKHKHGKEPDDEPQDLTMAREPPFIDTQPNMNDTQPISTRSYEVGAIPYSSPSGNSPFPVKFYQSNDSKPSGPPPSYNDVVTLQPARLAMPVSTAV